MDRPGMHLLAMAQGSGYCMLIAKSNGTWTPFQGSDPSLLQALHRDRLVVDLILAATRVSDRPFNFLSNQESPRHWAVEVGEPTLVPRSRLWRASSKDIHESVVTLSLLDALPCGLTTRELTVLSLLAGGLTNLQIGSALGISVRTVTTHVEHVMMKLSVDTRTAAGVMALHEGLIQLPLPPGSGALERTPWGLVSKEWAASQPAPSTRRATTPLRKRPLLLAAAFPTRGSAADDGLEMLRGTQLALKELNAAGGIGGTPVELHVSEVDVDDVDSVRSAFETMINLEPDAITSGYVGRQDVAHQLVAAYGSPYLHAATLSSLARAVSDTPAYHRIFQVCPSDNNYGPGFIRFITDIRDRGQWANQSKEVLVVEQDWPLADFGIDAMRMEAERLGWAVGAPIRLGSSPETWSAAAQEVARRSPAAILMSDYMLAPTVAFIRVFLENPSPTLLYCVYAPSIPAFRTQLGPQAEGVLWATVTGTYSDPTGRSFASRYRAEFGSAPGRSHAGISYDRVHLIGHAWAAASNPRDFAAVAESLRSNVFRGVNGAYFLGAADQVALAYPDVTVDPSIAQAHLVYQFQGLRNRIVSPAPYSEATFLAPPWITAGGTSKPTRRR